MEIKMCITVIKIQIKSLMLDTNKVAAGANKQLLSRWREWRAKGALQVLVVVWTLSVWPSEWLRPPAGQWSTGLPGDSQNPLDIYSEYCLGFPTHTSSKQLWRSQTTACTAHLSLPQLGCRISFSEVEHLWQCQRDHCCARISSLQSGFKNLEFRFHYICTVNCQISHSLCSVLGIKYHISHFCINSYVGILFHQNSNVWQSIYE